MTSRLEYLSNWHHETQSFIGLISMASDMVKVKKILEEYKPRFNELEKQRYIGLVEELNLSKQEQLEMLDFMRL